MNVPLTKVVFERIIKDAAKKFKKTLEDNHADVLQRRKDRLSKNEKVEFESNSYWEKNLDITGSTFWNIGLSDGIDVCRDLFYVENLYFYRTLKNKYNDKGKEVADVSSAYLVRIFRQFEYRGTDEPGAFFPFFIRKVSEMAISSIDKRQQIHLIRQAPKTGDNITIRNREINKWSLDTLTENFKLKLLNTKWYLYFYGYGLIGSTIDQTDWQIVRLILEFYPTPGRELGVWIENTENPDHYDYDGRTDFDSSTDKVLVLNLKTFESPPGRQLNIKLFVDGAEGIIFFGQYLNYEVNTGRIFSGDMIIEQVQEEEEDLLASQRNNPLPKLQRRKRAKLVPYIFKKSNSEFEEIKHIVPFFLDSKSTFRETKNILYTVRETKNGKEIIPVISKENQEDISL